MSKPTKIVVVGAGFGGIYAFKKLRKLFKNDKSVQITLVDKANHFVFTPMLHEVATGGLNPYSVAEPLRKIMGKFTGKGQIDFRQVEVKSLDVAGKKLETSSGPIKFDYLVMAMGSGTNFFNTPGASEHAYTLKSVADAVELKRQLIDRFERASRETDKKRRQALLRLVIVGGGPTGVELAAEAVELVHGTFAKQYPEPIVKQSEVILFQRGSELVPQFPQLIRRRSLKVLERKGVIVRLNTGVTAIGKDYVEITEGGKDGGKGNKSRLSTEMVVWVAGVKASDVNCTGDPVRDKGGRFKVEPTGQIKESPFIFVIGDQSHCQPQGHELPLPALAQVASRQGPAVAKNIQRLMKGQRLKPFRYRSQGSFVSLGHWQAVGVVTMFGPAIPLVGPLAWLTWRTVYWTKLLSWRKRLRVSLDWFVNLFTERDTSQLFPPK